MKRIALISTVAGALLLTVATPAFAGHVQDVLGEQTAANEIVFPPVTAGAGAILPDSPFYFVDKAFQNLKLSFAFSPERKALTRNMVIGERLAELRVMTERNNTAAIQETLNDITVQSEKMANELADAGSQGRNVTTIAQSINNTLRNNRNVLKSVSEQASGPLALQAEAASQAMLAAKVKVEEQLPDEQMLAALQNDLEDEVDTHVLGIQTSTNKLEKNLNKLDQYAGQAGDTMQSMETDQDFQARIAKIKDVKKRVQEQVKRKKMQGNMDKSVKLKNALNAAKKAKEAVQQYKNTKRPSGTPSIDVSTTIPDRPTGDYYPTPSGMIKQPNNKKPGQQIIVTPLPQQ